MNEYKRTNASRLAVGVIPDRNNMMSTNTKSLQTQSLSTSLPLHESDQLQNYFRISLSFCHYFPISYFCPLLGIRRDLSRSWNWTTSTHEMFCIQWWKINDYRQQSVCVNSKVMPYLRLRQTLNNVGRPFFFVHFLRIIYMNQLVLIFAFDM